MVQLILDGVELPESIRDTYKAYREDLGVELTMISGRMVKEVRGSVWHISYQHGYFDDETKNKLIEICERGRKEPINCGFLPQDSAGTLIYSNFFVTNYTRPKFAWSVPKTDVITPEEETATPVPMWYDFSVELREVRPSD